jgi:Protein of unknown function (DUF3995)
MVAELAGVASCGVLLGLSALHAHWARGGCWPATNPERLARVVVGGPPGMNMPGRAACWVVAALLAGFAGVVGAAAGLWRSPLPLSWLKLLAGLGAGLLLLRGLWGFVEHRLRPERVGSPYESMNRVLYSPLCLALSLCAGVATFAA